MAESSGLEANGGAKGHQSAMQVHLRKTLHHGNQQHSPFNPNGHN